ncbi:DUF4194 domain-containing protein [Salinibius halmophilus]|uniref:DUF4194 domain-containing protein n=1 Tax=Salinibius halmophilus TaxID=1853216 RepID=UPI000E674DD0|nr:DUF4194 domain-containing protein [Salinibius halmophilus]
MMIVELEQQLEKLDLTLNQFRDVAYRLLDQGIIVRSDSATEEALYDLFIRLAPLLTDYFDVLGIRLMHDDVFELVRAYPPNSTIPGDAEQPEDNAAKPLRKRLSQNEVAMLLALRLEYDRGIREARLDEHNQVRSSLESISLLMRQQLDRQLPESKVERDQLFANLRQLKVIKLASDFNDGNDLVWIRPAVVSLVADAMASANSTEQEVTHVS